MTTLTLTTGDEAGALISSWKAMGCSVLDCSVDITDPGALRDVFQQVALAQALTWSTLTHKPYFEEPLPKHSHSPNVESKH